MKSIALVSPVSGAAQGGTAAYIRYLGNNLAQRAWKVSGVSRVADAVKQTLAYEKTDAPAGPVPFNGWNTKLVGPSGPAGAALPHLLRFITRGFLQPPAIAVFSSAYRPAVEDAIPAGTQVVHYIGTGWELFGFPASQVARERGAAFTITPFVHPDQWGDSPLDVDFYNQADAVFICSDYEREHLIGKGVRPDVLVKTGMAPASTLAGDGARFRERHGLEARPLIFFLARKQRYKGYHVLREAMTQVLAAVPDACLVAAGPDGDPPYPFVPDANLLDLGALGPDVEGARHKADALAACDVFCMPSTAEAFGIVYVEAWAEAKPVIGGMAPALRELILDGVNGYRLAQEAGPLADTLVRLLRDPALREELGRNGCKLQRERFTWEAVARSHEETWADLAARRPR